MTGFEREALMYIDICRNYITTASGIYQAKAASEITKAEALEKIRRCGDEINHIATLLNLYRYEKENIDEDN